MAAAQRTPRPTAPPRQSRARLPPAALALGLAAAAAALGLGAGGAGAQSGKPPPLGAEPAPPPRPGWGPPALPTPPFPEPPPRAAPAPPGTGPVAAGKPPPLPPGGGPFGGAPGGGGERRARASGTGFAVAPGRVLTNHHVIEGCAEMRLRTPGGAEVPASVAASDAGRDLALLTVRGAEIGPPLRFRAGGPPIRRGEGVVTYGFPLAGLLSSGPTLTTGDISALSGLRDNPLHFQMSAPVQPGNSGGPLLDLNGLVVGVVTSKLNAQRVAQSTGDIPQNVNFAVKGTEAIEFLRRQGVQPLLAAGEAGPPRRGAAEVGEIAHPSVLFLRCMR
jgi:hypothetical protein